MLLAVKHSQVLLGAGSPTGAGSANRKNRRRQVCDADTTVEIDQIPPFYGVYRYGRPHLSGAMVALKGVNDKRK